MIGSNHTTNEENFYLQKFARQVLKTNNIDHHRTGDVVTLLDALSGKTSKLATVSDLYERKAVLVLGADLALEHPLLSYQIRANYRHHQAHVYVVTPEAGARGQVRRGHRARARLRIAPRQAEGRAGTGDCVRRSYKGDELRKLVDFAESLGIPVKFVCLVDYANSRGAVDMGLTPELLPGYAQRPGGHARWRRCSPRRLDVLWVVGANPCKGGAAAQDGFPRGAGHVPHRDGAAGRRRAARGLRVREERHGDEYLQARCSG